MLVDVIACCCCSLWVVCRCVVAVSFGCSFGCGLCVDVCFYWLLVLLGVLGCLFVVAVVCCCLLFADCCCRSLLLLVSPHDDVNFVKKMCWCRLLLLVVFAIVRVLRCWWVFGAVYC